MFLSYALSRGLSILNAGVVRLLGIKQVFCEKMTILCIYAIV